jgi:hypothetical protein
MSDSELKQLKKALNDRKREVKTSTAAATKALKQAGILTSGGNLKGAFKSLKH